METLRRHTALLAFLGLLLTGLFTGLFVALVNPADADTSVYDDAPEHVDVYYNETLLQEHQPKFVYPQDLDENPRYVAGAIYESPEYDTDVYVYWTTYTVQMGLPAVPGDSHQGDHEPVYVFVDDESGEVERVDYSAYHWLKGTSADETAKVENGHPVLRVDANYHHYYPVTPEEDVFTNEPEVVDLTNRVDGWIANDWPVKEETIHTPWTIQFEESWWEDGEFGVSVTEEVLEARQTVTGDRGFSFDIPFF